MMKSGIFWLFAAAAALYFIEQNHQANSQPIIPGIQPGGCLPGDPSVSFGGKTFCLPGGVITY